MLALELVVGVLVDFLVAVEWQAVSFDFVDVLVVQQAEVEVHEAGGIRQCCDVLVHRQLFV